MSRSWPPGPHAPRNSSTSLLLSNSRFRATAWVLLEYQSHQSGATKNGFGINKPGCWGSRLPMPTTGYVRFVAGPDAVYTLRKLTQRPGSRCAARSLLTTPRKCMSMSICFAEPAVLLKSFAWTSEPSGARWMHETAAGGRPRMSQCGICEGKVFT